MSKYMMNKFIRAVEMHDEAVARYAGDPAQFVTGWLAGGQSSAEPTDDRVLTDEERDALSRYDYAAMYRLGANPYLLWHFTEAVDQGETPWGQLKEQYREAISVYGDVDSTM